MVGKLGVDVGLHRYDQWMLYPHLLMCDLLYYKPFASFISGEANDMEQCFLAFLQAANKNTKGAGSPRRSASSLFVKRVCVHA